MLLRWSSPLVRVGSAVAFVLVLASCTPGGQFDPTQVFNSDVFDSKKKLPGQREPLFPNGVPGAETGVPPDLVKGYKPPPDQDADTGAAPDGAAAGAAAPPPAAQAEAKPKPRPKPKPKLARAPAPAPQDSAFDRKPPTRINVGLAPKAAPPAAARGQPAAANGQSVWPATPQTASQSASPSQSVWPASPQTAPAAQSGQSIWPNPPASGSAPQ
jgi:hypothetical protein